MDIIIKEHEIRIGEQMAMQMEAFDIVFYYGQLVKMKRAEQNEKEKEKRQFGIDIS